MINFKYNTETLQMLESKNEIKDTLINKQEQIIIDYIKKYKFIRRSTVEDILDVKRTRALEILKSLSENYIIKNIGTTSNSKYVLIIKND